MDMTLMQQAKDLQDYWDHVEAVRYAVLHDANDPAHVHEWFQADTVDSYRVCLACGLQEKITELED